MSQNEEYPARVRNLIANHLGVDEDTVTDQAHFCDDLGADSLDCVELLILAEEQFGIEIADDEAEKVRTVSDAVSLIGEKLGVKTPA